MSRIVIVTTGDTDLSLQIMARDLAAVLAGLGAQVEVFDWDHPKLAAAIHRAHVLNLADDRVADLWKHVRFVHPLSMVTVLAHNSADHTVPSLAAMLLHFDRPKRSGVPQCLVAHSPFEKFELDGAVRRWLSPSVARQVLPNILQISWGVSSDFQPAGSNNRNTFVVPYNRFSRGQKNLDAHISVSNKINSAIIARGNPAPTHVFRYAAMGEKYKDRAAAGPYLLVPQGKDRAEYIEFCKTAGVFISTSRFESFGIYYLELLASGAVGVFEDKPWNRMLLPDYRYRGSLSDLPAIGLHVYENFAEANAYVVQEVVPYIFRQYSLSSFAGALLSLFSTLSPPVSEVDPS